MGYIRMPSQLGQLGLRPPACTPMELSTLPTPDTEENIGSSSQDPSDETLDLESVTLPTLKKPVPGMWQIQQNPKLCCIYRVPRCLRQVNPEAYTPQLVLIGPLHHHLKSEAYMCRGDITNTKTMGYLNMEMHKKVYLEKFAQRVFRGGHENVIEGFRKIIEKDEGEIRASYSESTAWIESSEFVEMILHDCVFILEYLHRKTAKGPYKKSGDPLMDDYCLGNVVESDLILLENQLPFFLLKKLSDFCPIVSSFRELVIGYFFYGTSKIKDNSEFSHFTDLFRCVHVDTLPGQFFGSFDDDLDDLYHADKLHSGGVKFHVVNNRFSLDVEFKNGCLNMPCFEVNDDSETILRNIMALEQCHYALDAHVCNYIMFMDCLIDTKKDVELLVEKGILKNHLGSHGSVAKMVNNLCLGVISFGSYYSVIAKEVRGHYDDWWNKSRAVLKSVYFSNPWRGTATVAATFLLLLTLIQTVSSIIQVLQNNTPVVVLYSPR